MKKSSTINKQLWENYDEFAKARGRLVAHVLSQRCNIEGAHILDMGSGTGGVSIELARRGAIVTAVEIDAHRVAVMKERAQASGLYIDIINNLEAVSSQSFDVVVMLDVLEHLVDPDSVFTNIYRMLNNKGFVYISTPNKYSPVNILCDPHFSMPGLALGSRETVRTVVGRWLKWQPVGREDYPQLFGFYQLMKFLNRHGFGFELVNRSALEFAFRRPECIWNRPAHLAFIRYGGGWLMKRTLFVGNYFDSPGLFNRFLNSAWFIMAYKM